MFNIASKIIFFKYCYDKKKSSGGEKKNQENALTAECRPVKVDFLHVRRTFGFLLRVTLCSTVRDVMDRLIATELVRVGRDDMAIEESKVACILLRCGQLAQRYDT